MHTLISMANLAKVNFESAKGLLSEYSEDTALSINAAADQIERMEDGLNSYLVKIAELDLTEFENRRVTMLMYLTTEYARIGAYAMNIFENAQTLHAGNLSFSETAKAETAVIFAALDEIISVSLSATEASDPNLAYRIEPLEETVDSLNDTLKSRHIDRLKIGECAVESGVVYLDMLVNLERIADHCSNIAVYVLGSTKGHENISRHEYIETLHHQMPAHYRELLDEYGSKFSLDET
jgi:phosphate:Na+ symporter